MNKKSVDIQKLLIALENPRSDDELTTLNQQLGKYLDHVEQPLNMSFWETVRYQWWNYLNLAKLCEKSYDVREDDFVARIRVIERDRIQKSPHVPVRIYTTYAPPKPAAPKVIADTHTEMPHLEPITPTELSVAEDNIDVPIMTSSDGDNIVKKKRWYESTPIKVLGIITGISFAVSAYKWFRNSAGEGAI